ncbi:efflux RND transporter periplasmic adaptor subunit [Paraburkholderia rhynchosiae]|uniref:Efflux RND transporter periplasmic adaptor subunit n=1 Tax=Paraburkholderia rhynchosiae TaxID=487049 RepID=A0A2N7WDK7_9BURK|nr:efflux RND transporter periplasmic adaptor subunit [Paraburkholderia rhynchosiae]PMS27435.1 efflux RND transporter periplasmic adaptor subunit [Paraburkholderia rhynchosiae]CAB3724561.1 Multidrug resistance protein MdtA [Paraburkholderia rhynchosiae]
MSTDIDIAAPRRLRPLKLAGLVSLLAAAGVAATGIATRIHAKEQMTSWSAARAIPTVVANPPLHDMSAQALVLPGQLSAYVKAPIYARVPGYLHAWYADIGAHVKAGQLLGEIDTPDLDQQLAQARADLRTSQANETLAASTSRRWTEMLQQDSVSQQETDEKTSDLAAKRAMVAANQANVARLEALESFKRITAPFDGVVTARKTDVGALISAGGGSGPELFTVSDARRLRVYVSVPQNEAAVIRPGLAASLTVPERPGMQFSAKLVDTDDSITPSSGTLLVQLAVDNSGGVLIPGEYTEVHFELPTDKHAMTIPASALMFRESGLQVAVVGPGNRAMLKQVSVATDLGTKVVIASGLTATDRVIDNPPDSLENGDPVQFASTSATTALTQNNDVEPSHG